LPFFGQNLRTGTDAKFQDPHISGYNIPERLTTVDVTTRSSVFPTSVFCPLIPPREVLRSNLVPYRQYQRTTTTTSLVEKIGLLNCQRFVGGSRVNVFHNWAHHEQPTFKAVAM